MSYENPLFRVEQNPAQVATISMKFDPDLQFIVDHWNELSEITKLEINMLIRKADGNE